MGCVRSGVDKRSGSPIIDKEGVSWKHPPVRTWLGDHKVLRERSDVMQKWECTVCGYIYDPAAGDPDGGVEPGTAFEDIPDDWVCPECGVTKDMFEPYEE